MSHVSNTTNTTNIEQWDQPIEYVNMTLPNGEVARFNRVWSGYRFTDREVEQLMAGMEIRIKTAYTDGIMGSLDWQEYNGYEFLGFAPWDASSYTIQDAPFPIRWNGYEFTDEEQAFLRTGGKLLIVCTSQRTGSDYPVNVSFDFISGDENYPYSRWGIVPHFDEFNQSPRDFTQKTCVFLPSFAGKKLTLTEIETVRQGGSILYDGLTGHGRSYRCYLTLAIDPKYDRWRLVPEFV